MPFLIIDGTVRKVSAKPTAKAQATAWTAERERIAVNRFNKQARKTRRAKARAENYNNRMFNIAHAQAC